MKVIKPEKLKKGDSVAIISPSGPVPADLRAQFDRGTNCLQEMGLKVRIMDHAMGEYYYSSGTIRDRLNDFHAAFADKNVKAIIMSIGGSTANSLLDGIDFELIEKNPKIFMGISDGTTLLNPIFSKTGLVTFHGPDVVFTFGQKICASVRANLMKTFFEGQAGKICPNPDWRGLDDYNRFDKYEGWHCVRKGSASGRLIGGNVNCLMNLDNTAFRPNYRDTILFLEAYMMTAEELDMAFTHFKHAKVFDEISGMIIGHFYRPHLHESNLDRKVSDILLEVTEKYDFPIIEIGEIGHNVENYVIPIGCMAKIDSKNLLFSILETAVK